MLRRLATSLAATSALVLTATAPALADHGEHAFLFDTFDGNLRYCADLRDGGPQGDYEPPEGSEELLEELFEGDHASWNLDEDKNKREVGDTDDPPLLGHSWWTVSFDDEGDRKNVFLNVEVEPGVHVIVIVKGGQNGSNVFVNEPGENLDGLYAPTNDNGKHPTISHYSICKLGKDENGDDGKDDEDDGKDDEDESTSTPTPTPKSTKTPASVPTAVPAGMSGSDGGSMAPIGIAAAVLAMLAGGAALLRRHFAHQS